MRYIGLWAILLGLLWFFFWSILAVQAHEHMPGENDSQARVVEFYKRWMRPKGVWGGMTHRGSSCCYGDGARQDCFPVLAMRKNEKGIMEVMPDVTGTSTEAQYNYGSKWYPLNTEVEEEKQPDPLTSPDARAHVCIGGMSVVCYVGPAGS